MFNPLHRNEEHDRLITIILIQKDLKKLRLQRSEARKQILIEHNIKFRNTAICRCGCKKRGYKRKMMPIIFRQRTGTCSYQIKWYFKTHRGKQ